MKNLKKLVIASFMLVIAFVAVVSSTYAWFTQGQDAKVTEISIGVVDANKALLISKDNASWSRNLGFGYDGKITPVTMQATAGENSTYNTPVFKEIVWSEQLVPSYANASPVADKTIAGYERYTVASSFDANAKYYAKSTNDQNEDVYTLETNVTADNFAQGTHYLDKADNAGYIQMELYFQIIVSKASDWTNSHLYMDLTDLHAYNIVNNAVDETSINHEAESSFRMAVVYDGNIVKVLKTADETVGEGQSAVTYDGAYGSGKQFDKDSGWMKKMEGIFVQADNAQAPTKFQLIAPQAVYGKEANYNPALGDASNVANYDYDLVIPTTETVAQTPDLLNDGCVYISTDGLTRTYHLTLLVWMEGWDGDNTNAAASCQYRFALSFRAQ